MIKYLGKQMRKIDLQLTVRGQIVSIMKKVNFDENKLNVKQRREINQLIAILDSSKNLA